MDILSYIIEEALIIIPVLWILGAFLKATPKVQDWLIIWILLVVGVLLAMVMLGWTIEAFIQGVLLSGAAVQGHQLIKQTKNKSNLVGKSNGTSYYSD